MYIVFFFSGEQRYVNLGVHFAKHGGGLILTSRSCVRWQTPGSP